MLPDERGFQSRTGCQRCVFKGEEEGTERLVLVVACLCPNVFSRVDLSSVCRSDAGSTVHC